MKRFAACSFCVTIAATLLINPLEAAIIGADGGITLWVSYDNLDTTGATLGDTITEADVLPGGFSCDATNTGRTDVGAANSPPSCPSTGTCTGLDKVTGDIEKLADYIYASTEGTHYLRRVYVSDGGRAWDSADIKWNIGLGGSSAPVGGWANSDSQMNLQSAYRTCIHDVIHHELGHYAYSLPDRYANSSGYYRGRISGGTAFDVDVTGRDLNTVMSNNFPHLFVDTTNARIVVDYDQPGPGSTTGEVLTPDLLTDADATNDGPDRAHHGFTMPFAQDEWSILPTEHLDLTGVHTEGTFPAAGATPAVDIVIVGDDEPHPGTVLLLDRSGSMGVTTNGITAAQFVQEAGMFLYHSSEDGDIVGTYLYNEAVEELFEYANYDPANDLPFASFRNASGLTNIALALETAVDELIDTHGEAGVSGAEIYLMSDGRQTTGASLWDQVTRANERGIRIHTFSFGSADTTTMDAIATGSGGSTTPMSERDDAAELKMVMTRKFSTGRGLTPIHVFKGPMRDTTDFGASQAFTGSFDVPPKTRRLQFYAFSHATDASKLLQLSLSDPDGNDFTAPLPNNVAQKGRFNGLTVDKPRPGTWTYMLFSRPGSGLPDEDIELAAYADNPELKSRLWVEDLDLDAGVKLRAMLQFRYPLTKILVNTHVFDGGEQIASLSLRDDGVTGGDLQANDGIYSALLPLGPDQPEWLARAMKAGTLKFRLEAEFEVTTDAIPAPNAHYETGTTQDQLLKDYMRGNSGAFTAWATQILDVREPNPEGGGKPGLDPRIPDGGIQVSPGGKGNLGFVVTNARPLPGLVRVSLGSGLTVAVESTEDDPDRKELHGAFIARFSVAPDADPGPRTLRVQVGSDILSVDGVLNVAATPERGSSWIWVLVVLVVLVAVLLIAKRKKH